MRKLSPRGLNLIKKYEGCRLYAYKPVPTEKYWTIGWGHYGPDVKEGQEITQEQADNLLKEDMKVYESYVNSHCGYLRLNQNEFDALVSFTYNCGYGNLQDLTRNGKLNKFAISSRILLYTHAGGKELAGLVKRRNEEYNLFMKEERMIDGVMDALNYLVEKGRINNKEYWLKALDTTNNVNYLLVKWADDVATMENEGLLRIVVNTNV